MASKSGNCELCNRLRPRTAHHLIPRCLHSKQWFKRRYTKQELNIVTLICKECHVNLHKMVSEKDLGRIYFTKQKLLAHPKFGSFVRWVKKKDRFNEYTQKEDWVD